MANCKPNIISPIQTQSEQTAVNTFETLSPPPPPGTIPFVGPKVKLLMDEEILSHEARVEGNGVIMFKSMQQDNYRNGFPRRFSRIRVQFKSSIQDDNCRLYDIQW